MSNSSINANSGEVFTAADANRMLYVDTADDLATLDKLTVNSLTTLNGVSNIELIFNDSITCNSSTNMNTGRLNKLRYNAGISFETPPTGFNTTFVDCSDILLKSSRDDGSTSYLENRYGIDNEVFVTVPAGTSYIFLQADKLAVKDYNNQEFSLQLSTVLIGSQDVKGFANGITSADITSGDVGYFFYCYNHSSELNAIFVDSSHSDSDFTIPTSYTHFKRVSYYSEDGT